MTEKLRNLNGIDMDAASATASTHKAVVDKGANIESESRAETEEATGYATISTKTIEILENISAKKKLNKDDLLDVSHEISNRVESIPPVTIMSLINAMAPVDEYLQRHSVNVGMLNGLLGTWLGMKKADIDKLILVGLLHDCGKALMPPSVLSADRKLTVVEFEVIKLHPVRTYELLSDFPEDVRHAAASHHEKIDGTGYPRGLSGDKIVIAARITAVSDIYDAIVSKRAYKEPKSPFHVLSLFDKLCPNELDSEIVKVLKEHLPNELIGKPVAMSDGTVRILCEYDLEDIKNPMVEISGQAIKTSEDFYCVSMYNDD